MHSKQAIHDGISLAKKYGAELYVVRIIYNPFSLEELSLPIPSLSSLKQGYEFMQKEAKKDLDEMIAQEKEKGFRITEIVKEGNPTDEILNIVKERNIDLIVMLNYEESRLEHLLFGWESLKIIQNMPCSILLLKVKNGLNLAG